MRFANKSLLPALEGSTARAGAPFVRANVRRIRVLAALTLGYFVLTVARSLVAVIIQDDLGLERTSTDISFAPIVALPAG